MRKISRAPLNQRQKWRSVARYGLWRARQRVNGGTVTIPYVGNARLVWPEQSSSVKIQAKYGLGETADMVFCLHMLRPSDLFVDVGANAGVYTVLASKVIGAPSVAIEPVPVTHALLRQNIEANGIGDLVDARAVGAGSGRGSLNFTADLWSMGHVVAVAGEDTVQVPVETLDMILEGRVPRVMKIDVEGFEGEVLAGAQQTLSSSGCSAVIIEVSYHVQRYGASESGVEAQLEAHGFRGFWYEPFSRKLVGPGAPVARKWNKIFIKDRAFVEGRLTSAPAFEVRGTLL